MQTPLLMFVLASPVPVLAGGGELLVLEHAPLTAGAPGDEFGAALDRDGTTLVVGAPNADGDFPDAHTGQAYVYELTDGEWALDQELLPSVPIQDGRFGANVAVDGDTIVVSATDELVPGFLQAGRVYVFVRTPSGWVEEARIVSSDPGVDRRFGTAVAVEGDNLIVRNASTPVETYRRAAGAWTHESSLPVSGGALPRSLSIEGGVFVTQGQNFNFTRRVYSYIDEGSGWSHMGQFNGETGERFGESLEMVDDLVFVGAPGSNSAPPPTADAYVFRMTRTSPVTWTLEVELEDAEVMDHSFGRSVAYDGRWGVAATHGLFVVDGSVSIYDREQNWDQRGRIVKPQSPEFGAVLDVESNALLVADPGAELVHVYELVDLPGTVVCTGTNSVCGCLNNSPGNHEGCQNSSLAGASLFASGTNSVSANDLALESRGLPGGVSALLFAGDTLLGSGAGEPFGDGLRCVGGAVQRLGIATASASGTVGWTPGAAGFGVGQVGHFQVWYRDAAGPCGTGFNLSSALSVSFQP